MDIVLKSLEEVMKTPYIWLMLGFISSLSMFISPIFCNGNYKLATKTIVTLIGYIFIVSLIDYFHIIIRDVKPIDDWMHIVTILVLVGLSYIFGIFIGIYINRIIIFKKQSN